MVIISCGEPPPYIGRGFTGSGLVPGRVGSADSCLRSRDFHRRIAILQRKIDMCLESQAGFTNVPEPESGKDPEHISVMTDQRSTRKYSGSCGETDKRTGVWPGLAVRAR